MSSLCQEQNVSSSTPLFPLPKVSTFLSNSYSPTIYGQFQAASLLSWGGWVGVVIIRINSNSVRLTSLLELSLAKFDQSNHNNYEEVIAELKRSIGILDIVGWYSITVNCNILDQIGFKTNMQIRYVMYKSENILPFAIQSKQSWKLKNMRYKRFWRENQWVECKNNLMNQSQWGCCCYCWSCCCCILMV